MVKITELRLRLLLGQNETHFKNLLNGVNCFLFSFKLSYKYIEYVETCKSYGRFGSSGFLGHSAFMLVAATKTSKSELITQHGSDSHLPK